MSQKFYEPEVIINVNEALVLNTVIGKIKSSQVCQLEKCRSPIINVKYLPNPYTYKFTKAM